MKTNLGRACMFLLAGALVGCATAAPDEAPPQPALPPEPAPEDAAPLEQPDDGADSSIQAIDLSVSLVLTQVAEVGSATAAAAGPDDTLFVADRAGFVQRLGEPADQGSVVVDISAETTTDSERGLLGMAFAPDGTELFLSYTDRTGRTVIEAFRVHDGEVDERARRTVFTLEQPYGNHTGGDIAFGPDGLLYVALGDGGGGGDPLGAGQDRTTLLGAILRLDPLAADPYSVPDSNPFVDDPDAADEIFLYGVRNPWRMSFDRLTGELWVADVGQNAREEINRIDVAADAGANLGWNLVEGTLEFAGREPEDHHPPVHEYETTSARCAVTGGYVYRGDAIPELYGAYVFSDYCEGEVRAIVVDEHGAVTDEAGLGINGGRVVSFGQDARGELYVLSLDGAVYRIDPEA